MLGLGGKIRGARSHPIGIAVTTKDVCLVQRLSSGDVFDREPLPDHIDLAAPNFHTEIQRAISTALRRSKFVGRQAVSALPVELLRYKTLRLPMMPADEMVQAIAWEASERFQLAQKHCLEYYCAGPVTQGNEKREEIILLAAERTVIHDHAMAVKNAGLIPVAIDATAAALARLLGHDKQSVLTIHLGETIAEIVGHRGSQVIFNKPIELAQQGTEIDIEALCREVSLCIRYLSVTFGVHQPDAIWIASHHAAKDMVQAMSDGLRTEVKLVDQAPEFKGIDLPNEGVAQWCVAAGLSMRSHQGTAKRGAA